MTVEKDVKDALKAGRLLMGTRSVVTGIKSGKVSEIVVASNCPEGTRKDISHYTSAHKVEVNEFKGDSVRLGEVCGKPFNILLLGIKKQKTA